MKYISSVMAILVFCTASTCGSVYAADEKNRHVQETPPAALALDDYTMCLNADRDQYAQAQTGKDLYFAYRHSLAFARFLIHKYPNSDLSQGLVKTRSCIQLKQFLSQYYRSDIQYIYTWDTAAALKAYRSGLDIELYNYMMSSEQYEDVHARLVDYLHRYEYETLANSLGYEHSGLRLLLLMAYFQNPDAKPAIPNMDANVLEQRIVADYLNMLSLDLE